jgi:hypothetical protein
VPYYIYRMSMRPLLRLDQLAQCASFKQASAKVKLLRAAPDQPPDCQIRMIFAENELAAEDLLSQVRGREAGAIGDE